MYKNNQLKTKQNHVKVQFWLLGTSELLQAKENTVLTKRYWSE